MHKWMGVHKYKWFLSVVVLSSFLISDFHICSSLCGPRGFHLSRNTECSIPLSLLLEGALLWLGWMMLRCGLVEVDMVWLRNQREVVTIRPLLTSFWLTLWVGHCFRAKGRSIRSEFKVSSAVLSWKQQHLPFWWSVWIQGQWFV